MSDYRDTEKEAKSKGIILDKCGEITRHYDWGVNIDLCGMTPEQIVEDIKATEGDE